MDRISNSFRSIVKALLGSFAFGCATQSASPPPRAATPPEVPPAPVAVDGEPAAAQEPASDTREKTPFVVPRELTSAPVARRKLASHLSNPRGLLARPDGSLLVSEAGTGDPEKPNTGTLLRLVDLNRDGDFDDAGERTRLLSGQPSKNILEIVQRDEVFGMADVAEGGGTVLATLAFFGGPSTVFRVDGQSVSEWANIHGNLNDITYDDQRRQWFAVSSSSDEVLRIYPDGRGERIVKIPPLAQGQDPVPGYVHADPRSGALLVSLFSGSTRGEAGGDGTDIVARAGAIVRVDPDTGATSPVVQGLTAPTDFLLDANGVIYVLELCDAFLEPIHDRAGLSSKEPRHGGFRRFSGRLLRLDPANGTAAIIAEGLDAPTNLAWHGNDVLIAEGMGTPGRAIPGPDGKPMPLEGIIEALKVK